MDQSLTSRWFARTSHIPPTGPRPIACLRPTIWSGIGLRDGKCKGSMLLPSELTANRSLTCRTLPTSESLILLACGGRRSRCRRQGEWCEHEEQPLQVHGSHASRSHREVCFRVRRTVAVLFPPIHLFVPMPCWQRVESLTNRPRQ